MVTASRQLDMAEARPRRYVAFGNAVAAARARQGWSQPDLAEHAGLSVSFVGHMEMGQKRPRHPGLKRLARALDVDYNELAVLADLMDAPAGDEAVYTTPEKAGRLRRLADLSLAALDELLALERVLARTRLGRTLTEPMLDAIPNAEAEHNRRSAANDAGGEAEDGGEEQRA